MGRGCSVDLKCFQCSKTLSDKRSLQKHLVTHISVQCQVCSKSCKNLASLSSHVAKLHSTRVHSCQFCHRDFPKAGYLRKHTKSMHTVIERPRLPCKFPECAKTFLSKGHATRHFKQEHVESPIRFPCNFCPKEFKTRKELDQHIATHTTEKPHQCAKCGKSFAQAGNLKRHSLTHQDQPARKRLTCHLCPQTFLSKSSIQRHVKIYHENRKEHRCTFCDKIVTSSSSLKRHIEAKHNLSGILHSCNKCGYQSCSRDNLAHHVKLSHSGKSHECYFCGKAFPIFTNLARHFRMIHNLET